MQGTTQTTQCATETFDIIFIPNCGDVTLDPIILEDMETTVKLGTPIEMTYPQFTHDNSIYDTESTQVCGPVVVEIDYIQLQPEYLVVENGETDFTFVLESKSNMHIGTWPVVVNVYLQDYPSVSRFENFDVTIDACVLTDLQVSVG